MKSLLRALSATIVKDYRINWIYAVDAPREAPGAPLGEIRPMTPDLAEAIAASPTAKVVNSLSYARAGMAGLVLSQGGKPLCVAHFARPEQYDRAATWPLPDGQMALMDIATEECARGQGLAPTLIASSARHFLGARTRRLIAFIWWSNTPSVRAFTKAGWRRIGLSIELCLAGRWLALHLPLTG